MNRRRCRWCLMDLPVGWPRDQELCIHCMAFSQEKGLTVEELIRSNFVPPHMAGALLELARRK